MSEMLNQFAKYDALELIGGRENLQYYEIIENLMTTVRKMVLAKSKPFKHGKHCLEATVDYYNFYGSLCFLLDNQHTFGLLNGLNTSQSISPLMKSLISNIMEVKQLHRLMPPTCLRSLDPQLSHSFDNYYTGIWNSLRGLANSNEFKSQEKKRKTLITKQCQENTRHLGRLLRQYNSVLVSRISFKIYHEINAQGCDVRLLDQTAKRLHQNFINHIRQINLDHILCIQSRIQRTMTGQCYVNILVYAKPNAEANFNIDLGQFRDIYEKDSIQLITFANNLLNKRFELFAKSNNFNEVNFEEWKVFFKYMLYPLNHYYYESKYIKPLFTTTLL
ncbi:hypothetical protein [Acinetobacter sp. ANC 4805]|uniref:hypothetical protein n=1 Tax=Acinetobacter sp. ANC 4805 TaxID=2923425 RepID=UPI001F4BB52B|nr:hypothetical protein [Acinetobacter sp. ANC 4805]MCH7310564.1 hypothetical protein [Acinetobacter sp. ANC 4805]